MDDKHRPDSIQVGPPLEEDPMLRDRALTLGSFLHEVSAANPDSDAIVSADGRITYAALLERAQSVARLLVAHGVGVGSRVAILLPNGAEWVAAFFGTTMIGGIAVALNTFAASDDLEYMLSHGDARVLLTAGSTAEGLASLTATIRLDDPDTIARADEVDEALIDALSQRVVPEDDALILFTSGSTGRPKAVLHTHRAICIQSWRWQHFEDRRPTDRVFSTSPFFWTSGLTRTLGSTLAAGATVVVQERFEPGQALELLEREGVTAILSRHHLDHRLVAHEDFAKRDLSSVRRLYPNSPLAARLGPLPVTSAGYGMTETMTLVSQRPTDAPTDEPGNGNVLSGMTVRIVDTATGEVLPRNSPGRICVRGVTVMRGYYKRPRDDAFDADGYFLTSDLGKLDDEGRLYFISRLDNMIKVAGATVYPAAVEQQVAAMGGLLAFSVFALPHPALNAALVLCAAVAPATSGAASLDEDAIREHLRSRLASYQVPKRIVLLEEHELSFTSSQKIDLATMRRLTLQRMLHDDVDPEWSAHLRNLRAAGELTDVD